MKRILFLVAILLLGLAFLTTAVEVAARAVASADGQDVPMVMPLGRMLPLIAPDLLARLQDLAMWNWLEPLFAMPGWVLFGVPGLAGVLAFRHHDPNAHDPELEESLFLFDELSDAARKERLDGPPDDVNLDSYDDFVPADDSFAEDLTDEEMEVTHDYLLTNQDEKP